MELGLCSFGEVALDAESGRPEPAGQRMRDLVEEMVLADQVGLDVFAIGEHHRADFAVSSPAVVLAAAASRTEHIRLSSAVTVLSSDDPVRVFQDFATVDLISDGRAEIMAGRGSFIESFPLFGYELDDYDELFSEKLELLLKIARDEHVTWSGRYRAALDGQGVYPRPVQDPLPVWIAVGGTPNSVVRAATLGLPLAIAIIGGAPARFAPLVGLYRDAAAKAGHDADTLPVAINGHGFISEDSQAAADAYWPSYAEVMSRIGRERGWPGMTRDQYDMACSPAGHLFVGSPQQVIDKILYQHELFENQRLLLQFTVGRMPHADVMKSIELFGNEVAPVVRREVGQV